MKVPRASFFLLGWISLTGGVVAISAYAVDTPILTLSYVVLSIILAAVFLVKGNDFFSPLTWFSVTYSGYALGGIYYSFGEATYGKFIRLAGIPFETVPHYMIISLLWVLVCYVFLCFGYSLVSRRGADYIHLNNNITRKPINYKISCAVAFVFIIIGFLYWLYVANAVASGPLDLILKFQAFRHLVAESGITTLPYHFYYAGIYVWLLAIVSNKKRVGPAFIFLSLLGMLINLTQGRIMLSITFVLSQLFFIGMLKDSKSARRILFFILMLAVTAIVIYFLRILSNYYFIGLDRGIGVGQTSFYLDFLDKIIGSGNVADLQQLVIIFQTWHWDEMRFGVTYLDWLRNSIGKFFGFSPSSIGLTIRGIYFDGQSGAPTPGAIGEAFVNFGILAPFFMFFVGSLFSVIYNHARRVKSAVALMLYSIFLARFILLYPKVDSTMLLNFLWGAGPFLVGVLLVQLLCSASIRRTSPQY